MGTAVGIPFAFTAGTAPPPPLIGHGLQFLHRPLDFLKPLIRHGDLVEIHLGAQRVYVICHPALVHQILRDGRTHDRAGPPFGRFRDVLGNGLATCPRSEHKRRRRLLQLDSRPVDLERYGTAFEEETARLVGGWWERQVLDVYPAICEFPLRGAVRTLFAGCLDEEAVERFRYSFEIVISRVILRVSTPSAPHRIPTRSNREYDRCLQPFFSALGRITTGYRADTPLDRGDHGDLLSMMLAAKDGRSGKSTAGLSNRGICDSVVSMMAGGSDALGAALTWSLHLLTHYPEIEQRLHAEVDAVLVGRSTRWAGLDNLGFSDRIPTETMPPVTARMVLHPGRHHRRQGGQTQAACRHQHPHQPRWHASRPGHLRGPGGPRPIAGRRNEPPPSPGAPSSPSAPAAQVHRRRLHLSRRNSRAGRRARDVATIAGRRQLRPTPGSDMRLARLSPTIRPRQRLLELTERQHHAASSSRSSSSALSPPPADAWPEAVPPAAARQGAAFLPTRPRSAHCHVLHRESPGPAPDRRS
ncbi:cytochrome P450 [Streptomyces albireticuli]